MQLTKEKKTIEERLNDLTSNLGDEEEKVKQLNKLKHKYESIIAELEERLKREQQLRAELEKAKRRLEAEVGDLKEQLAERNIQMEEQQAVLNKREEELQQTLNKCARVTSLRDECCFHNLCLFDCRVEDEASNRTVFQKQLREVESQLQEVQEDLDTEKEARNRAEKQKRDLRSEFTI